MLASQRAIFNQHFTQQRYEAFLADLSSDFNYKVTFRVAETPVFIPADFRDQLLQASQDIVRFLLRDDFKTLTERAIPQGLNVPNEDAHTQMLALDFGVCKGENGTLIPQLIEMQGFPSLYFFQHRLAQKYQKHYPESLTAAFSHLFGGISAEQYEVRFRTYLLGAHAPEEVILLEIEPQKQNTAIDFLVTEHFTGIRAVCISEIIREGRQLFYMRDGVKTHIKRIYNRIIFDELLRRPDLQRDFNLTEAADVEWAGHPNWFFRISKYTMPLIESRYIPECRYLSDYGGNFPSDLENYVLKPLFSFSGQGVKFNVTAADIAEVPLAEQHNYMLQRKVEYVPVVEAADGGAAKLEIRLLYLWEADRPQPELLVNLCRLSRGEMIGVRYNKDKTWVGGSVCFFEQ